MIDRRDVLLGAGALLLSTGPSLAALPVPSDGKLSFRVFRKGSAIGQHELTFNRTSEGLVVRIAVDLAVKLGPVPLYRYTHRATETWRGDTVVSIEADTNDNGATFHLSGERRGAGLSIDSSKSGRYEAPADALPATHWNRRMLNGPFINTQTGELMRPTVAPKGEETIETVSGRAIKARRFSLSGPVTLDTWYDDTPLWAGLRFMADDGAPIDYRKL